MTPNVHVTDKMTLSKFGFSKDFLGRVSTLKSTNLWLVSTNGTDGQQTYSVPFVDLSIVEEIADNSDKSAEALGCFVTLDNAGFLILSLASSLADGLKSYSKVLSTQAPAEPATISLTKSYLAKAQLELDTMLLTLSAMSEPVPT